jgi:hypothetical protein
VQATEDMGAGVLPRSTLLRAWASGLVLRKATAPLGVELPL